MRRLVMWVFIVSVLGLFSTAMLGTAFAKENTVKDAAAALAAGNKGSGKLVVLETTGPLAAFKEFFGVGARTTVCWVDASSYAALDARYDVSLSTVTTGSGSFDLVTVRDADAGHIRQILRQNPCQLVHKQRTFFLPFDPHTS